MEDRTRNAGSGRRRIRKGTTIALAVALALTAVPATAPTVAAGHVDCLLHGEGEDCTRPFLDHVTDQCQPISGTVTCVENAVNGVLYLVDCLLFREPPGSWVGGCTGDPTP